MTRLRARAQSTGFLMPRSWMDGMISLSHMNEETRSYRLPPRLRRTSDFRRVKRFGKRHRSAFLVLYVSRTLLNNGGNSDEPAGSSGRVGFTVPEKAVKGAVKRNRIRRLMKEAVRLWWCDIRPGHELLLIAHHPPKHDHADYVEVVFLQLLLQLDLLTREGRIRAEARLAGLPEEFCKPARRRSEG